MTAAEFKSRFHDRCRTNDTIFPDTKLTILAREKQIELAKAIESVDEDFFLSFETTTLKATGTSADEREYPLPEDSLNKMKLVEAKLDGTNWVRLQEFDLNLYEHTTDEDTILEQFGNDYGTAFYDIGRNSLFLYTGEIETSVVAGLHWIGYALPYKVSDWAGTTDLSVPNTNQSGIPISFHGLWLDACVIDWKQSHDKPVALTEGEQMYNYNLQQQLLYAKELNRDRANLIPTPESDTDNGYDL
jgi:hypothetical protein